MGKLLYAAGVSVKNVCAGKKLFAIIILSYYFGLLMPFYCLANIEVFADSVRTIDIADPDRTYFANIQALYGDEGGRIEEALRTLAEEVHVVTRAQEYVRVGELSVKLSVAGTGEELAEFERLGIKEGTFSLRAGKDAAECVFAYGIAKQYGLRVGDSVTVGGIAYRVSGITNNFNYYKTVFIPRDRIPASAEPLQHTLYLRGCGSGDANWLKEQIGRLLPEHAVYTLQQGSERTRQTIQSGIARSAVILLAGAVSVLIAVWNTYLVVVGKYEENKKAIAVKLALGASKSEIGAELLCENLLLIGLSNLMLWMTSPILIRLVPVRADFLFTWRIYVGILGISVVVTLVMSLRLRRNVMRTSLTELLKGD